MNNFVHLFFFLRIFFFELLVLPYEEKDCQACECEPKEPFGKSADKAADGDQDESDGDSAHDANKPKLEASQEKFPDLGKDVLDEFQKHENPPLIFLVLKKIMCQGLFYKCRNKYINMNIYIIT